jgi:hypothetical protein
VVCDPGNFMRPNLPCGCEYRNVRVWKSFSKTDIFLIDSLRQDEFDA